MKFNSYFLSIVCLSAAVLGCNKGGGESKTSVRENSEYKPVPVERLDSVPYKPGEEELLFPMKVGNAWTYEVEENIRRLNAPAPVTTRSELILRCTNVVRIGDKVKGTIESVYQGRVNERQVWTMDKSGLYQTSVGDPAIPYTPPMPAFRSPLTKGAVVEHKGRGFVADGSVTDFTGSTIIDGPAEADTGIGRVNAMAVRNDMKWAKGVSASTTWYAPKIGIVRWRQEVSANGVVAIQVMRLTKLDLK